MLGRAAAFAFVLVGAFVGLGRAAQAEESCVGRADALGTARVLSVDAVSAPRVGRKSFRETLPLGPKEIVLTFDDGPWAGTTPRILDTLRNECVRATFFLIGRNAVTYKDLARREIAEGHTVAYHTFSHPWLNRMRPDTAKAEIDHGFTAVDQVLYGEAGTDPVTPFFRFPGFASTAALLDYLEKRGIVVFGADLWAGDWIRMSPQQQLQVVLKRIEAEHGGIVLFHDTKQQTATMLPLLLRSLKIKGYQVVHIVPAVRSPAALRIP